MKVINLLMMTLIGLSCYSQTGSFTVKYNGISPTDYSPHKEHRMGHSGIHNPERGFTVRAGLMDVYAEGYKNESGDVAPFYEDVNGDISKGLSSLTDYLHQFDYDGISMVELEQYVHFTEEDLAARTPLNQEHLSRAEDLVSELKDVGVKAHFIMNSSFNYFARDNALKRVRRGTPRYNGLMHYLDEMSEFYETISPMVAVAQLGWIYSPWDYNSYRHSSKWKKQNFDIWNVYPVGTVNASPYANYEEPENFHNEARESVQRSDWGAYHGSQGPTQYGSDLNLLRKGIMDNILEDFPYQKVVLNSTYPFTNYIGSSTESKSVNEHLVDQIYQGPFAKSGHHCAMHNLKNDDKYVRVGYYDGSFAGDSYSHAWTIPDGEVNEIHWYRNYKKDIIDLGKDYGDNKYNVDAHNLRKYRHNFWMHGEMPVYETADTAVNTWTNQWAWKQSSFTQNHCYFQNWYPNPETGENNTMFDYETAEAISSGKLQDGLMSAVKLRYFNFTSFGIMHNNLLDGRSPFEMTDNYDKGLSGIGIPHKENTGISGWKESTISLEDAKRWHLPISDRYFLDKNGNEIERTAYEYIRDHLGYRLELQEASFIRESRSVTVKTDIINRGFAAPQNPRRIFYVLMDENNEVLKNIELPYDWRDWQPDDFAVAHDNTNNLDYNADYNSLDEVIVGGIPLGAHQSNWHRQPLDIEYNPYVYSLTGKISLEGLAEGLYKIGIVLPDMNEELMDKPEAYAVRFANQVPYLECSGISVLGSVVIGDDLELADADADGIRDEEDVLPLNPINFENKNGSGPSDNCTEWDDIPVMHTQDDEHGEKVQVSIYPNPTSGQLNIRLSEEFDVVQIKINNILGYEVCNKRYCQTSSVKLDLSEINRGAYICYVDTPEGTEIVRFVKE